jgi:hypothetical protein
MAWLPISLAGRLHLNLSMIYKGGAMGIPVKKFRCYIVVRHCCDGFQFYDSQSLAFSIEQCKENANKLDKAIPGWAKDNFQVRVAHVELTEINE